MTASLIFDTAVIEARLRDQVPALDEIGGAAEYAVIERLADFRPGSAYVVLAGEQDPNHQPTQQARITGKQQVITTFGVITAVRNYSDNRGDAAMQDLRPLAGAIREALMGWCPGEIKRGICWSNGDVLAYDKNTLLWIDVFTVSHYIGGSQ